MHADGLIGSTVTGSLTFFGGSNYFDPTVLASDGGDVPAGDLNAAGTTVQISPSATEFGYEQGGSVFTADFTDNSLTLGVTIGSTNGQLTVTAPVETFTDSAFAGLTLSKTEDTLLDGGQSGVTFSLVGDQLTVDLGAIYVDSEAPTQYTAVLNVVPEPSTWSMLIAAALVCGAGLRMWRRA